MTVRMPSAYLGGVLTPRSQESRFVAVQTHTLVGKAHLQSGEVHMYKGRIKKKIETWLGECLCI